MTREMHGTVPTRHHQAEETRGKVRDLRSRISDNIACALLVYTALQILVTTNQIKTMEGSLLPYLALIVLVAAIIPSCRWFEAEWDALKALDADDPALARRFRRDRRILWIGSIGLPFVIAALARLLHVLLH